MQKTDDNLEQASGGESLPVEVHAPGEDTAAGNAEREREADAPGADAGASAGPGGELERWKDLAARSQAELDNYRKRMARERAEALQFANRSLLEQLMPILDNFEMGLRAAEQAEGAASSMILQGMGMVHKQLGDFLEEQGVRPVPSDGEAFDPNLHEAVKQEPHESAPEGTVLATLRRGYRLRDRLLRAATVVVSSGPPEGGGAAGSPVKRQGAGG